MGTTSGTGDSSIETTLEAANPMAEVATELREAPYRFEFFQAMRLLERIQPDRKTVGRFTNPKDEAVRMGSHPSLDFPASQIQSLEWSEDGSAAPKMKVNFLGLVGSQGVLPHWYTTLILERMRARDSTIPEFLDIFHHRLLSFFYQAWEKYRFAVAYERGERDKFSHHLLDLIGLGTQGLQNRQDVDDDACLYFAGLLSQRPRSARALELLISDYFEVPVRVEQMLGSWNRIAPSDECWLGERVTPSEQLGMGALVGDEVWDQQARARICIGPLSLEQYLDFLPDGSAYPALRAMARFFSGGEIDYEVQLILDREEVPRCELGGAGSEAPRLGWVTWMKSKTIDRDPQDTILKL
jgi:type VI secretion system protein ImpH